MRFSSLFAAVAVIRPVLAAPISPHRETADVITAHDTLKRHALDQRSVRSFVSWLCDLPRVDEVCQKTSKFVDKWRVHTLTTVATPQGRVAGLRTANTFRYTVPYAKAPVGNLRFQPPLPVSNWDKVYNASALPPICPQSPTLSASPSIEENCLFMNIWVPASANAFSKLPVFVWLHGGSFVAGSSSDSALDGSELAAKGNMIVITVQYRLGLLGFLRAPALGIEGNMGLLDVVEALNYVQKNIAAFGGNRATVTLAGQSSGASLIKSLLSTPRADSLFHRAILQSAPLNYGDHTPATSTAVGQTFLDALSCSTLACLQAASIPSILSAQDDTFFAAPSDVPGVSTSEPIRPVIDGSIVTQAFFEYTHSAELAKRNRQVLFTTVKHEAGPTIASISQDRELPVEHYPMLVQALMDADRAQRVLASGLYDLNPNEADAARDQLELLGTDWVWRCPNQQAALELSNHGSGGQVWIAEFNAGIPYPSNEGINFCQGRICHQDDIKAVFNTGEVLSTAQTALEDEVLARWSSFARIGNPNVPGYPEWSAIQAGPDINLNMLALDGASSSVMPTQRKEQCGHDGFWGKVALFDEQLSSA